MYVWQHDNLQVWESAGLNRLDRKVASWYADGVADRLLEVDPTKLLANDHQHIQVEYSWSSSCILSL